MKQLKVCDPLYGYIYFDEWERALIEHPLFQRLRSIQQLGFSQYAFPSGTGNRFIHSLGASYLAGEAFESIFNKKQARSLDLKDSKKKEFKRVLKLAALFHDIGHGPLSHSSECLMPPLKNLKLKFQSQSKRMKARHEDYSVKFITETDFADKIHQAGADPKHVAQVLNGDFGEDLDFFKEKGINYLPLLRQIISSELDVDRMDYLHRDSVSCGVRYGLIDFMWLLSHFDCYLLKDQLFLSVGSESLYTIESFLLGRQHMRIIVYFHHKAIAYNEMLKEYSKTCSWHLPEDIDEYTHFTDSHLFNHLKKEKDNNEWASRICNNNPFVRLYEFSHLGKPQEEEKARFNFVLENLDEKSIPYLVINSKENSITPYKGNPNNYPVFLKNSLLKRAHPLFEKNNYISIPQRGMDRIYIDPQYQKEAEKFLF